jgi:hypothetical protein
LYGYFRLNTKRPLFADPVYEKDSNYKAIVGKRRGRSEEEKISDIKKALYPRLESFGWQRFIRKANFKKVLLNDVRIFV